MRMSLTAALVIALGVAAFAGVGQPAPAAKQGPTARIDPVTVPTGDAPVITDGFFTPGEWDDALKIPVEDGVTMFLKEFQAVVFIGVRGASGPTDLRLAVPGVSVILSLHASYALGQVRIPFTGAGPALRLGLTTDWYANENRRDDLAYQRMLTEGGNEQEALKATTHPLPRSGLHRPARLRHGGPVAGASRRLDPQAARVVRAR